LLPRSPTERFLPLLLIGALLFCHGTFGALHLICGPPECADGAEHAAQHQHAAAGAEGAVHEHPAGHATGTEYFAVVVGLLGLLSRLLLAATPLRTKDGTPRFFQRWRAPIVSRPPPTPTLHVLQVFRL
jgi:hypothetical protein